MNDSCNAALRVFSPSLCSVGRRQFVSFDSAQVASSVLGCEGEELHTAVFKHHLRQLLQRATGGSRERNPAAEAEEGMTHRNKDEAADTEAQYINKPRLVHVCGSGLCRSEVDSCSVC